MKAHYILLGIIATVLAASCASNTGKWNNLQIVNVAATASNRNQHQEQTTNDDGNDTFAVKTSVPYDIKVEMDFLDGETEKNSEACQSINRQLISEFLNQQDEDDVNKAVNTFIERLANQMELEEEIPAMYDYFTGKANFGMSGIVNYVLTENYYSGGAHPTSVTTMLRFNTDNGHKIDLEEVFVDTCMTTLTERLTTRLMRNLGVASLDSLHKLGYLDMIDMFVTDNFMLEKDSITFFYNPYDIAPYAVGTTTIKFSYDELKDIMHK